MRVQLVAKLRSVGRALSRYSPLGIAGISLLLSGAAFFNTIYQQDREADHKELLIRPQLFFVSDADSPIEQTYQSSISIRNDGLGPAVIHEVIVSTSDKCVGSSTYTMFSDWDKFYQTNMIPQFQKLLTEEINILISSDRQTTRPNVDVSAALKNMAKKTQHRNIQKKLNDGKGFTDYEVYDVSGVDTLSSKLYAYRLGPGMIISAGSSLKIAEARAEMTTNISRVERVKQIEVAPAVAETTALSASVRPLDALKIGIGYCSLSRMFCDFIWQGDPKCFEEKAPATASP